MTATAEAVPKAVFEQLENANHGRIIRRERDDAVRTRDPRVDGDPGVAVTQTEDQLGLLGAFAFSGSVPPDSELGEIEELVVERRHGGLLEKGVSEKGRAY